jgi:hypothetical protein
MAGSPDQHDDDMRDEYDFRSLEGVVRGKYAVGRAERRVMVRIDPDIAAAFPDEQAVNSAPVTLAVWAEFPAGAKDHVKRAVAENATNLGFTTQAWE